MFDCDGKVKAKNLPSERVYISLRIKIERQIVRNQVKEGAENLDDTILEPMRESLRARRRQAAYEEVVDELGEFTDDSDFDDE